MRRGIHDLFYKVAIEWVCEGWFYNAGIAILAEKISLNYKCKSIDDDNVNHDDVIVLFIQLSNIWFMSNPFFVPKPQFYQPNQGLELIMRKRRQLYEDYVKDAVSLELLAYSSRMVN